MELKLQNAEQHKIADLLWTAKTEEEVNSIVRKYGRDGRIVYEMMIAATFDNVQFTDLAQDVLKDIMNK